MTRTATQSSQSTWSTQSTQGTRAPQRSSTYSDDASVFPRDGLTAIGHEKDSKEHMGWYAENDSEKEEGTRAGLVALALLLVRPSVGTCMKRRARNVLMILRFCGMVLGRRFIFVLRHCLRFLLWRRCRRYHRSLDSRGLEASGGFVGVLRVWARPEPPSPG